GELYAYLSLLLRRERVYDAVDGLRGVVGMERGEHEVARFGGGHGGRDGLGRAHLAYHEHINVLPEDALERRLEIFGVHPHFALLDERLFVFEQILDGVLDGDDVLGALLVYLLNERRERGGLSLPHGSDDQEESLRAGREGLQHRRQVELREGADGAGNKAQRHAD